MNFLKKKKKKKKVPLGIIVAQTPLNPFAIMLVHSRPVTRDINHPVLHFYSTTTGICALRCEAAICPKRALSGKDETCEKLPDGVQKAPSLVRLRDLKYK